MKKLIHKWLLNSNNAAKLLFGRLVLLTASPEESLASNAWLSHVEMVTYVTKTVASLLIAVAGFLLAADSTWKHVHAAHDEKSAYTVLIIFGLAVCWICVAITRRLVRKNTEMQCLHAWPAASWREICGTLGDSGILASVLVGIKSRGLCGSLICDIRRNVTFSDAATFSTIVRQTFEHECFVQACQIRQQEILVAFSNGDEYKRRTAENERDRLAEEIRRHVNAAIKVGVIDKAKAGDYLSAAFDRADGVIQGSRRNTKRTD